MKLDNIRFLEDNRPKYNKMLATPSMETLISSGQYAAFDLPRIQRLMIDVYRRYDLWIRKQTPDKMIKITR